MQKSTCLSVAFLFAAGWCFAAEPTSRPAATAPAGPAIRVEIKADPAVANGRMQVNNFADMQRRQVEQQRTYITGLAEQGTFKRSDLVRMSLVDGILRAETSLTGSQGVQMKVKVTDSDGAWMVICQTLRRGVGNVGTQVTLNRYDFDKTAEGEYWQTILNLNDQYLMIHEQGVEGGAWFQQMGGGVHLNANTVKNGRGQQVFNLNAANILQLHAEHPEEVRKYLVPMLIRLTGRNVLRPGAADVYAVFDEIPADPTAAQKVAKLLPRLAAELFEDRDLASKELGKLGVPGIVAALRLERSRLSAEQKGRIDAFLSTERRRSLDDPAAMRKDAAFLMDALEDDDAVVRAAAKTCLEALVGHPVAFDLAQPPDKLGAAVDALRKALKADLEGKAGAAVPIPLPAKADGPLIRPGTLILR